MPKIQCRILKKTAEGEAPYFVLETRAKSFWWTPWSEWTRDSSFVTEEDAISLLEWIVQIHQTNRKKERVEQLHFAQVKRK